MMLKRPTLLVRNFTTNLMAYAVGRRVEYYDQPTIRAIAREAEANDYHISSLIMGVVKSGAFQMTRPRVVTSEAGGRPGARARARERVMRTGLRVDVMGALLMAALLAGAAVWGMFPEDPMVDAAKRGDTAALRELIRQGADVNQSLRGRDDSAALGGRSEATWRWRGWSLTPGRTCGPEQESAITRRFTWRAGPGARRWSKLCSEAGSEVNAATTNSGATALHLAAESGNAEVIGLLVDHGADVQAREAEWGQTPLILAAAHNRPEAIRALVQRDADPGIITRVVDVPQRATVDKAGPGAPGGVGGTVSGQRRPGRSHVGGPGRTRYDGRRRPGSRTGHRGWCDPKPGSGGDSGRARGSAELDGNGGGRRQGFCATAFSAELGAELGWSNRAAARGSGRP